MKSFFIFGLALVFLAGCDFFRNDDIEGHEVVYYVTASSLVDTLAIEYTEEGSLVRDSLTGLLWTRAFLAESAALELSAQNLSDTGLVRAFIFVDDELVAADSVVTDSTAFTTASVQYDF